MDTFKINSKSKPRLHITLSWPCNIHVLYAENIFSTVKLESFHWKNANIFNTFGWQYFGRNGVVPLICGVSY